jgi:hypothetical protein
MIRAALVAVTLLALPAVALAQSAPNAPAARPAPPAPAPGAANPAHPAKPKPKPTYQPGHGGNGYHNNGNYETNVVVDPNQYLTTPKPHKSNPPSHVQQYPGTETFSSQSTGSH